MQLMKTTAKRRTLALFVAVIMALTVWVGLPLQVSAETDGDFEYSVSGGTATITKYTGTDPNLNIPLELGGYPVTALDNGMLGTWMAPNTTLRTVTIPSIITSISYDALNWAPGLTAINVNADNPHYSTVDGVLFNKDKTTLVCYPTGKTGTTYAVPNSVTSIGQRAFISNAMLNEITIPTSVMSIERDAFNGCKSLTKAVIGAKTLAEAAFYQCPELTEIIILDNVSRIEVSAFMYSPKLKEVTIDGVTLIGQAAFYGSVALKSVTISNVDQVDESAFSACYALETVTIDNVNIGRSMFQGDSKLTTVSMNNVTQIGPSAFHSTALTKVELPESVENIGERAFFNISTLTDVIILNGGTTTLGEYVFNSDPVLTRIWCYGTSTVTDDSIFTARTKILMLKGIALDKTELGLRRNDTANLTVSYDPADGGATPSYDHSKVTETVYPVMWTSSNTNVASVGSSSGTITAKAYGTTTITATVETESGYDKIATCEVTVAKPASITSFKLAGVAGVITPDPSDPADSATGTIEVTVPSGTVLTGLTPVIVHNGTDATTPLSPLGSQDFSDSENPVIYTVKDSSGTTRAYTVIVKLSYELTVTDGSGGGSYVEGDSVTITANTPVQGKVFDKWTTSGVTFANPNSATTSFTMPANAVTVTANYKDAPSPSPQTYAVTVTGGTGSASYPAGATVTITANAPASGKVFDTWTTTDGVTFTDANNAVTSFVMPANAVTVTATYADDPQGTGGDPTNPTVTEGWAYENGVWKYFVGGVAKTGWVYDQSKWYYLSASGVMQTGWVYDQSDKAWYYLSGNGAMVASKWLKDADGSWYYLSGNGKMLTGKHNIGGKAYSFKGNGVWVS